MREIRSTYKILLGRDRYRWEDDVTVNLKKYGIMLWTGFIRLMMADSCGYGNESPGYMNCKEFLEL
jgi:hypothetical protein